MKRVVIIGPESTGKSTLSQELADHYATAWCPEYAREYLTEHGMNYTYEDLANIAQGQLALQERIATEAKNGIYFIDTDLYVMKVWYEVAFNNCPTWILKQIAQREYDLYLLCDTDLAWAADELREYPDLKMRQQLFNMYKDIVINSGVPWCIISGTDAQRLQSAIAYIDRIVQHK